MALVPATEAEFVALVDLARPLLSAGAPATVVVPALDHDATVRRVRHLVGDPPGVAVEPIHEYLGRGHDRVALVGDDPVARGRSLAAALDWLRAPAEADGEGGEGPPDRSDVVAWLATRGDVIRPATASGAAPAGTTSTPPPAAVPLGGDRLLVRTAWGARLVVFGSDRSLTPDLALDGVSDPAFVRFLQLTLRGGDVAVDVGANVGVFSVLMAQLVGPAGRVLALEADPEVHAVLAENLDLNHVSGWAEAAQVAAYSSRAQLAFHRTGRFRGDGSLGERGAPGAGDPATEPGSTTVVEAVPLDDLVPEGVDLALVRIDVEGAERQVLEGLSRTVDEGRVRIVALEFVRVLLGSERDPLVALLAAYGQRYGVTFATIAADGSRVERSLPEAVAAGSFPQLLVEFPVAPHG